VTASGAERRAVVAALASALALLALAAPDAPARSRPTASKAVTFTVPFVNAIPAASPQCAASGTQTLRGHLVGPRSALSSARRRGRSVTLYVHGLGFGEWFWNFSAVPGYDYATAQARRGHTSLVFDRLGYDSSDHPPGDQLCLEAQAFAIHSAIRQLESGSYAVTGGKSIRFRRIALAGHSAGAEIADIEAYTYRDVDALIVMSFSYANLPRAQIALGPTRDKCLAGGEPAEPGLASGYAFFGQPTAADFQAIMFANAAKPVLDAASALRNRDPCGDVNSIVPALLRQRAGVAKIKVPVLIICGTRDALYSSLGCGQQEERYTRSRSTKLELVKGAGHALTLERTARTFRRKVARWLQRRGF
jgi:pimeloyl-ACP methyl ester carboxylesterase